MVTAAILGEKLIESFNRQDLTALNDVLHPQLLSYITNREGGITELKGSKAFIDNITAWDTGDANRQVTICQNHAIHDSESLLMVEIIAKAQDKSLINYASFLLKISEQKIHRFYMVEAHPKESDIFWKGEHE